jgi:hypothetical protein
VIDAHEARAYLIHSIQLRLYNDFFCVGGAIPGRDYNSGRKRINSEARTPFQVALSAANAGRGSGEVGWRVRATDGERVIVERHGLCLWVEADEIYRPEGTHLHAGTPFNIRLPKELLKRFPGFYLALGDEPMLPSSVEPVLRLYWHVTADAAPHLISCATTRLNAAGMPFRLKSLDDPQHYTRCDAAVLYVPKRCYLDASHVFIELYCDVRAGLLPATPAFTKQLAPGLAVAEDPPADDSFGTHRCGLLAQGVIFSHEQNKRSVAERLSAVISCFEAAAIDIDRPYLNPGSADDYEPLSGQLTRA